MTGHSPSATTAAIEGQSRRGITLMLPTEDSGLVGGELALMSPATTADDVDRHTDAFAEAVRDLRG
jgi:glutamate-1-semialdehyde 2,1-aminomutase